MRAFGRVLENKCMKIQLTLPVVVFMILACTCGNAQPNIIFMMADDHAAPAISCYGSRLADIAATPHIDRIAKEGVLFNNCFCTNSICTPSRAAILTGKYSKQNGVLDLADKIDSTRNMTFPSLLQKHGYYTGIIGKWHLHVKPFGFDYWKVMVNQGQYHDPYYWEKGMGWQSNNKGARQYEGYVTDICSLE